MNTEKIENEKEEVLKIVNEDFPMLEEIGKRRFVIKKKNKDIEQSLNVLQSVLEEDTKLAEMVEEEPIDYIERSKTKTPSIQKIEDEKIVVANETPSSQTQKIATTITHSEFVASKPQSEVHLDKNEQSTKLNKTEKAEKMVVTENSVDLVKLVVAGFTHLYVSRTSTLLKPIRFVLDNYKDITIAALHFIVPMLMTYFITTNVSFVTQQLAKETNIMKIIYIGVFFFGATFVWITSQVILSGIFSMLRKSMLEVAKVGKENQ